MIERMKLLVVNPNLRPGGAERQLYNLGCYLLEQSVPVEYLLFEEDGRYIDDLKKRGAVINVFPKNNKGRVGAVLSRMRYLNKLAKEKSITSVVSFLPTCNIVCELAKLLYHPKWKLMTGARRCESLSHEKTSYKFHYWFYSASDVILSNSYLTKDDILKINKIINADKIKVIYNYLQIDSNFYNEKYEPSQNNIKNVVVAANYGPTKNITSVIEALKDMDEEKRSKIHIDWYGVIQTDAAENLYEKSKEEIEKHNLQECITINDTTPKIYELMSKADAVGLFSYSEGFPNCICEGLYLGKTIICTPVSDIPRILKDTKNIVCDGFTPESIRKGLEELIELPVESIKTNVVDNHRLAEELFSVNNIKNIVNQLQ